MITRFPPAQSAHRVTRTLKRSLIVLGFLLLEPLQPVWAQVDPEVGPNDFQLSFSHSSLEPGVAYSPNRQEYLAAWWEMDYDDTVVQRLDILGEPLGGPIVTGMGFTNDVIQVTHDPINDRFLVTAALSTSIAGVLVDPLGTVGSAFPITGKGTSGFHVTFNPDRQEYAITKYEPSSLKMRLVDANGQVIGLDDIILTLALPTWGPSPRMAYNTIEGEYLLIWVNSDGPHGPEVWTRRFDPDGVALSPPSSVSSTPFPGSGASYPDIAYHPARNEYLIVWSQLQPEDGFEVFGQRLDYLGAEIGLDDFQISDKGRPGNRPRVETNTLYDRYLVTWQSDLVMAGHGSYEVEVAGQYLSAGGATLPPGTFRVSEFGPPGDTSFIADFPSSAFAPDSNEFLVVFSGRVQGSYRVYGQRLHGAPTIFSDGFETGNDRKWSSTSP